MNEPLSRFTPSLMPASTLEAIFVARGQVLDSIMQRVETAATSETRNQTLLVGPRGAGKTHLIALAYHRTKALIAQGERLQLAWLPEDPWTIASYRHLLAAIAERLEGEPAVDRRGSVAELEARLVARADERGTIVVLLENLDRVLNQLGDEGQQKFRHFLQHECPMLLIATTTTLDRNLADQARPFFGYFTTTRLKAFTPEQGRDMLAAIAAYAGDDELNDFLGTDLGLGRVRAVAHLAGGQPRLWALLSSSLRVRELDTLVDLLLTRFDDLTPYYQEQLSSISPQQRLIVAELAEADHPLHVGALAERLDIDQRSVAKAISDLVDRGWLRAIDTVFADLLDRRRTYYELAEPMARLSFQMKESRGEPLRLVVDFLKAWFDPTDLRGLELAPEVGPYFDLVQREFDHDAVGCIVRRLTSLPATRAPAVALLGRLDDALSAAGHGDASLVLEMPTPVRMALEMRISEGVDRANELLRLRRELHRAALEEVGLVPTTIASDWVSRAERLVSESAGDVNARVLLAAWLGRAWRFDQAVAAIGVLMSEIGDKHLQMLTSREDLANSYWSAGRTQDAITLEERILADAVAILGDKHADTLIYRANLATSYWSAGRTQDAIALEEQVLADCATILGDSHPDTLTARANLATSYLSAGRTQDAIALEEQILADCATILGDKHPDTLTIRANLAASYWSAGRTEDAVILAEQVLTDRETILGDKHRHTLTARSILASSYLSAGRTQDAVDLAEQVLTDRETILGDQHPETLTAGSILASSYWSAGRTQDAIALQEHVLEVSAQTLGLDHPNTRAWRESLQGWRNDPDLASRPRRG